MNSRREDIAEEDIEHIILTKHDEEQNVKADVKQNKQQFECGKCNRSFLVPQIRKWNTCECIDSHSGKHHLHKLRMVWITQHIRNRLVEDDDEHRKQRTADEQRNIGCLIDCPGVVVFSVGKAEESGLHAIGEKN